MPSSPPPASPTRWRGYIRISERDPWRLVDGTEADDQGQCWALKAVCGPSDNGEPVVTVLLPDEDRFSLFPGVDSPFLVTKAPRPDQPLCILPAAQLSVSAGAFHRAGSSLVDLSLDG